jgi:hypothetical protein
MKDGLISRFLAVIVVGLLLGWGLSAFSQKKESWLAAASPDEIATYYRHLYTHGFVFHAIVCVIAVIPALLVIEAIAAIIRRYVIDA